MKLIWKLVADLPDTVVFRDNKRETSEQWRRQI